MKSSMIIHPDELSKVWLIEQMKTPSCRELIDYARERGLEVEYEIHAAGYLMRRDLLSCIFILWSQEKSKSKDLLFLSNPKDWYVIAAGVWHHAQCVSFLRIDSIQTYGLIPYHNKLRITYAPLRISL